MDLGLLIMVIANSIVSQPDFPNQIAKFLQIVKGTVRVVKGAMGVVFNYFTKAKRSYVDSNYRKKVKPIAGSVVYCDLYSGFEHSGIYVNHGEISNIVVNNLLLGDSEVKLSDVEDFTSGSHHGKNIYVSCNTYGAVGDKEVSEFANSKVGEKNNYGVIFNNCHEFSRKCLMSAKQQTNHYQDDDEIPEKEETIRLLKKEARRKLGATKWLLWDLEATKKNVKYKQKVPEPEWQTEEDFLRKQPLTPEFIEALHQELQNMQDYLDEIADENIPSDVIKKLKNSIATMQNVLDKYKEIKEFLLLCPDAEFSYEDLKKCQNVDFIDLAKILQNNQQIKDLARKMGRNYISEQRKKQTRISTMSKSEMYGIQCSYDLMRLLPSELVNIDDDDLEYLFYARLLEKNLLTYALNGITFKNHEENEDVSKCTGPVVACLDTSGSMEGEPLQKARALLFAIANILKQEKRLLHVVLFGATGQTKEYQLHGAENLAGLLQFLAQGFGGSTDFETPLQRAMDIIQAEKDYEKADILMISDGDCTLSQNFIQKLNQQKQILDFSIYSVLCHGQRQSDNFSDEVVVL